MKLYWRCGCGGINYNREDWLAHFKYRGFWRGVWHLIRTRPTLRPY